MNPRIRCFLIPGLVLALEALLVPLAAAQSADAPKGALGRLGSLDLRHVGSVTALRYVADGNTLLSAGNEQFVHVWDPITGKERGRFGVPSTGISALSATPDSNFLYATSFGGTVTRVARESLDRPDVLKISNLHVVTSPTHMNFCAVAEDGVSFELYDRNGKYMRTIDSKGMRSVEAVFSRDGSLLALTSYSLPEEGPAKKFNKIAVIRIVKVDGTYADEEVKLITIPGGFFFKRVEFLPGNEKLVAGGIDGLLRLIDIKSGIVEPTVKANPTGVARLELSPDATLVATGGDNGDVRIFSTDDLTLLQEFTAHRARITSLAFTPDNQRIATGGDDALIRIFDVETAELVAGPNGHDSLIASISASRDGTTILTGGADGSVRIWDSSTFECLAIALPDVPGTNFDIEYSPTEDVFAVARQSGVVQLFDTKARAEIRRLAGGAACLDVSFFPDGDRLAVIFGDKDIAIYNFNTGEVSQRFPFDTKSVPQSIAVSHDGNMIAAGSSEIVLFNPDGTQRLAITSCRAPVGALLFDSTDSLLYAGLADSTIRVYDPKTGEEKRRFEGSLGRVESLALSPNGKFLASVGLGEKTPRIWSTETGKLVAALEGHDDNAICVTFLDDARVASGAADMTGLVWPLPK